MTDRSMADDSSEQVPGQQTNESSLDERNPQPTKDDTAKGLGSGPHAGEGDP
ncbi:hypothetical protein MycrhN_0837 [Mycolicibacterium rhodesiae NBB3]|jgi:hypothetical protein|uniref:Uncharacterized protein n=1 Tax=Mycolicibacterium rhodesiae (strain NBB3) TaxID=710685 RepID=G8RRM7_MYCRN|nr:hypothetical protein [Mycolicibacterium rhodesiae]AEV71468.1 hypothetical protein MycrhN_0837 [Mycolicibacterium rhodesiae NBB3]